MHALQSVSNSEEDDLSFRGFNDRLVTKNPDKTAPMIIAIKYAQYMRHALPFSLVGGILGLTPEKFKGQYGSQFGRIGSASATSYAGIPVDHWGRHGDWASFKRKNDT